MANFTSTYGMIKYLGMYVLLNCSNWDRLFLKKSFVLFFVCFQIKKENDNDDNIEISFISIKNIWLKSIFQPIS